MKKKILPVIMCAAMVCQAVSMIGCGASKENNNPAAAEASSPAYKVTASSVPAQAASAQVSSEAVIYVTAAERSLKVISGYTLDNNTKKEVTKQPLAGNCVFYNHNGEQTTYAVLADAVAGQTSGGIECRVQYEGKQIVRVDILDKSVN